MNATAAAAAPVAAPAAPVAAPPRCVLIGFGDALAAPEVAMSLTRAGHRVVGFARRGRPVALRRLRGVEVVEVTAPEDDLAACEREVAALAATYDATMPLDDPAVFVCERALSGDAPMVGPREARARLALDKRLQLLAAEEAGFRVPAWEELEGAESDVSETGPAARAGGVEPKPARGGLDLTPRTRARGGVRNGTHDADPRRPPAPSLGPSAPPLGPPAPPSAPERRAWEPPFVLKPALAAEAHDSRLRRLAPRLVATTAEARELRETWGPETPVIAQRWVAGEGAGVFGLADADGVHHLSAHRRVRMMNPAGSGSSACASAPVPRELIEPIERLLLGAGWRGMFMVELLRDRDGGWWFMELNGRPWGSLALARRRGLEYPAWALARALDENVALPAAYGEGKGEGEGLLCRHLGRELVHLLFVLRGPGSYTGPWPSRRATLRALLGSGRRTRGAGWRTCWYNLEPGTGRLFVEDIWRTVAAQTWAKGRR